MHAHADGGARLHAGRVARVTRRRFIGGVGAAGAAGAVASGCSTGTFLPASHDRDDRDRREPRQNFGRMFPDLPPFADGSDALRQALADIGRPGGLLDANDNLAAGPVELITDPALSAGNQDNATPPVRRSSGSSSTTT